MKQNQNPHTPQSTKPTRGQVSHANFIEALKSSSTNLAKDAAKSYAQDFVGGTAKGVFDSFFGAPQTDTDAPAASEPPFDFNEYLTSNERRVRAQQRVKYEYERAETVVFNRRQEEIDKKIESIRVELKKIAQEVSHLDQATEAAISQEVVDPGTYHLNFFEKLLSFLQHLRKRVVESRHWANLQSQRSQSKSYYWHMSQQKVAGTTFSLSQERTLATQTG